MDLDLVKEILAYTRDLDIDLIIPDGDRVVSDRDHKYLKIERDLLGVDSKVIEAIRDEIDFKPNKLLFANDEKILDQTHIRWTQSLLNDKDFNPDGTPKTALTCDIVSGRSNST